jgi:hypothetical protein
MEQINKLETIFTEGSLTDQLNAVETSLLRGGTLPGDACCDQGIDCSAGNMNEVPPGCTKGCSCSIGNSI